MRTSEAPGALARLTGSAVSGCGTTSGALLKIASSWSVAGGCTSTAAAAPPSAWLFGGGAWGLSSAVSELAVGTDEGTYPGIACSKCASPTFSAWAPLSEGANPPTPKGGVTTDVVVSVLGDTTWLDSI